MERGKFKRRLILAAISIALIAVPTRLSDKVRLSAMSVFTPLRSLGSGVKRLLTRTEPEPWIVEENRLLRAQLERSAASNQELRAKLASVKSLEDAVDVKDFDVIIADVGVPTDSSIWRDTMTVSKGSAHGVRPGMIAVFHNHLVGKVQQVSALTSRVILSTDPQFKIGAVCTDLGEEVSPKRMKGYAQGEGQGQIRVKWLQDDPSVRPGVVAVTTLDPQGGIPKGLIVAQIRKVDRNRGRYLDVLGEPPTDAGALEYVMILSPKKGS